MTNDESTLRICLAAYRDSLQALEAAVAAIGDDGPLPGVGADLHDRPASAAVLGVTIGGARFTMTAFDYTLAGLALAANLACLAHAIFRR